jgi:O-antigen/teichoic acid export membrane protein
MPPPQPATSSWRDRLTRLAAPLLASQLRRNMVSGLIVTIPNFVVTAVSYPLYLHYLGYERYGLWLVLTSLLGFAQLGNMGIAPAVSKFVAEDFGRHDFEAIQRIMSTAIATLTATGAITVLIILGFRHQVVAAFKLTGDNSTEFLRLLPYVGVLHLYAFVVRTTGAALTGLGRMDVVNYARVAERVVMVALAVPLFVAGLGIVSLLVAYYSAEFLVHVFFLVAIPRVAPVRVFRVRYLDAASLMRLMRFGGGVMGGTILSTLTGPLNKLLLSRYAGVESVPIYEIAWNATM